MSIEREIKKRSGEKCELCSATENLKVHTVAPRKDEELTTAAMICTTCENQINGTSDVEPNHWRCLNDSMWSEHTPVKVLAYRMLFNLKNEGWPQDLLDMMYMEEAELDWAKETLPVEGALVHKDSNGVTLQAGDSVVLIKDLQVKGSSMIAKRGTAVRNIRLDPDNETYIEGKVDGQQIVIITEYVKKT